jgi:CysZ protein
MGRALSLAFQQLPDPAFRRILVLGIGLSLVVFAALGALTVVGFHYIPPTRWHWLDDLVAFGGAVGFLVSMWLLFPAVVSVFIGLLLDDVAEAVERRHYPQDPPGVAPSMALSAVLSLRLMIVLIVLNILVLPLYVVALFVPFLSLAIFLVLNGYLMGREYFELVATRHMTPRDAKALRRAWRGRVFVAGLIIAGLFSVPFLNLLAPILGAAFMMHVFKALPGAPVRR